MKHSTNHIVFKHWYSFLALGFGSGLSPMMPGSVGTLVGVLLAWVLAHMGWQLSLGVLLLLTGIGVVCCDWTATLLGESDPQRIVWDEIVGYAWIMMCFPWHWMTASIAFFLFRLFDIIKPGLIGWCDRNIKGGLGIMVDDLAAASVTVIIMTLLRLAFL